MPLYDFMIYRVKEAEKVGKLKGLLFFQGETDAGTLGRVHGKILNSSNWDILFNKYVRNDLGLNELTIVFAQIGSTQTPEKFTNWKTVQEKQKKVSIKNVAMIKTNYLPLGDWVNFSTSSYIEIGKRFSTAYLKLI